MLTVLLVITFAFFVLRLSGDPAMLILSPDAPPEAIAAFRHSWGLDQPVWVQYLRYFGAVAHGDFGQSMRDGRPALQLVVERIPATLARARCWAGGMTCRRIDRRRRAGSRRLRRKTIHLPC